MSNDLSELTRVAAWVQDCVARYQVPSQTAQCLDLCSTEVITNIVTHGYVGPGRHGIVLRLDRRDDHLALEIEDDGMPFDPRLAATPERGATLEEAAIGGWGLQIVRQLSDGWQYCRSEGRNHLTLLFRLSDTGHAPAPRTAE